MGKFGGVWVGVEGWGWIFKKIGCLGELGRGGDL